jgi:hypothetical protein
MMRQEFPADRMKCPAEVGGAKVWSYHRATGIGRFRAALQFKFRG